jgi:hypothetical protein
MPLNFPSSPTTSTTYTFNNRTWTYNGNAWALSSGGSLSTSVVPEGNNLYYTNARSRAAISVSGSGSYDNSTGIITITGGVSSVGGATGAVSNAQLASGISNATISNLTLSGNVSAGNVTLATNGVLRFPDGTTQNTASSTSGTLLNIITRSGNVAVGTQNRTLSIQGRSSNTTVAIA